MDKNTLVIYHANCADGFGAAFVAWRHFVDKADYVPMAYHQEAPDVTGKDVYILDFSFKRDVLERLDAQAKQLVLLDHHISAQDELAGFKCRCGKVHFDLTKCGMRLAWEHFQPGVSVPWMVNAIEDRDLWAWKHKDSPAFLCALDSLERSFEAWNWASRLTEPLLQRFIDDGAAMLRKTESLWRAMARNARPVTLCGVQGSAVNAPQEFRDELGNYLSAQCGTFALVWAQEKDGGVKVSVRGAPGYDALPLAVQMGGGGHASACSFYLRPEQVPALMAGSLG